MAESTAWVGDSLCGGEFATVNASAICGFHMVKKGDYTLEEIETIEDTARELKKMHTKFYTGHCTGEAAFALMKKIMRGQLTFVHSGDEIV